MTNSDLPFIISDVLGSTDVQKKVNIKSYALTHAKGLKASTSIALELNGKVFEASSSGEGQYDAFWKALNKIYKREKRKLPKLIDYATRIPAGSDADALCETTITWKDDSKEFSTRGLDSDQTVSAIQATEKMLNIIEK